MVFAVMVSGCAKSPNELIESAKNRESKGDLRGAIIDLKGAIQGLPDDATLRSWLGRLYNETFDPVAAEKELSIAREKGLVEGGRVAIELARAYRNEQKYKLLLKNIEPSPAFEPDRLATIYALRGRAFQALGDNKSARGSFAEAAKLSPENADVVLLDAQLKVVEGQLDQSLAIVERLVTRFPTNAEALLYMAGVLRALGRNDDALAAFAKVLAIHPLHFGALRGSAVLLTWRGKLDEAQKHVDVMKKVYKGHPQVLIDQGTIHFAAGRFAEARSAGEAALKIKPGLAPAELLLGLAHQALGSSQQAEQFLSKYLTAYPGSPVARYALAAEYLATKQPEKAAKTLERVLQPSLKDPNVLALAGDIYSRLGDLTKGMSYFERAARERPDDPRFLASHAFAQLRLGNADAGFEGLQHVAGLTKSASAADEVVVVLSLARGDYEGAARAAEAAAKRAPDSPITHNLKGLVLLRTGKEEEAIRSFEKALGVQPGFFPAAHNLARIDLAAGNAEAARRRYDVVLGKNKSNVDALLAKSAIEVGTGRIDAAIELLESAIKADPARFDARRDLVSMLLARNEKQRAAGIAEDALSANPDDSEVNLLAARVQLALGNANRSIQIVSRLQQASPGSVTLLLGLAEFQLSARRFADAEASVRRALQVAPGFEPAQRSLAFVLSTSGKHQEALAYARDISKSNPRSPLGWLIEGQIHEFRRSDVDAVNAYREALKIAPTGDTALKLFQARSKAGDRRAAVSELQVFATAHPKDPLALSGLGFAQIQDKEYKAAASTYEALVKLTPRSAEAMNGLAWAYHLLKDERALLTAEAAFRLNPSSSDTSDTLGLILLERGETKRAVALLAQAAAGLPTNLDVQYNYALALSKAGDSSNARERLKLILAQPKAFDRRPDAQSLYDKLK